MENNRPIVNLIINKLENDNLRFIALDDDNSVVFYFECTADKARLMAKAIYDLTLELNQ